MRRFPAFPTVRGPQLADWVGQVNHLNDAFTISIGRSVQPSYVCTDLNPTPNHLSFGAALILAIR